MSKSKALGDLRDYAGQVASKHSWVVNPDTSLTEPVLQGLTTNFNRLGRPYCPCRDLEGPESANRDIVCPCVYAAADVDEFGQCYCGLYLSTDKDPREVISIPERRTL